MSVESEPRGTPQADPTQSLRWIEYLSLPKQRERRYLPPSVVYRDTNTSSASAVEQSLTRSSRRNHVLSDPSGVLSVLSDDDSQRVLITCGEVPRTVQECAELCDTPLSTIYQKLGLLIEASLLDKRLRVQMATHHLQEFATNFDTPSFSFDDAGASLASRRIATDGGEDGAEGQSR